MLASILVLMPTLAAFAQQIPKELFNLGPNAQKLTASAEAVSKTSLSSANKRSALSD
jgi:hypothetical protein